VFVYPIGVPALFLAVLWMWKDKLYADQKCKDGVTRKRPAKEARGRLGSLYTSYKPNVWWWEVADLLRKLLITGLVVFMMPGTPSQLAIGCLLAMASLIAYVHFQPYNDKSNGYLQLSCQIAIFVTLFAGLIIVANVAKEDGYNQSSFGGMIVAFEIFPIIIGVMHVLFIQCTMCAQDLMMCGAVCFAVKKTTEYRAEKRKSVTKLDDLENTFASTGLEVDEKVAANTAANKTAVMDRE